ncbi:hypothetical protein FSP39_009888 [Pinctada imbricata]|uniref:Sulfotransferase domain-containing protein n=1 Tax=Pinctada imbricata TaxID=66713 RepID=A0AA88XN52_PINIB|nr:hypothetical protein FSP39_009888 [Pinctada imbricata]
MDNDHIPAHSTKSIIQKSETEGIQNQDKTGTKANKQKPPPYEKKRTPDMGVRPGAQEEEGRFQKKDGDIEFDFITIDGIGLCAFDIPTGGYPRRINEVMNLAYRPGDVILATYPKCGTHWGSEIINMIVKKRANYMKETKESAMLEALPTFEKMLERLPSPRVLNSHFPYKWFPREHIQRGGKVVHLTRNPKDTYVSFFHHCKNLLDLGHKTKDMTWTQFFDTCVIGKDVVYGTWFDYEKEIDLAKKTNKNIYTLHYENMKENPEREIQCLATFLDVQLSDSLIKDIANKCEFQNLKKADEEVKENSPEIQKMFDDFLKNCPDTKVDMYRKGIAGDWKNHFTMAQNEQFENMYEKEMRDTDVKVIY